MKQFLYLVLISIVFASCKKNDDGEHLQRLSGWRSPDCGSTIGEGSYEAFNDSEAKYMIRNVYPEWVETFDTTVVSNIAVTSHTVNNTGTNNAFFEYNAKQPLMLNLFLLINNDAQQISQSGQIVESGNLGKTSFNLVNALSYGSRGCHRLYYVFTQKLSDTKSRIVNKGHFDIDIQ